MFGLGAALKLIAFRVRSILIAEQCDRQILKTTADAENKTSHTSAECHTGFRMINSETPAKRLIADFLAQRRFAMVGVSRNPGDFSRMLFREFLKRGYEVVPVHPDCQAMDGHPCAPSIAAVVLEADTLP